MNTRHQMMYAVPEGADALVLIERAREAMPTDGVVVHVALDDTRVAVLAEAIAFFAPDVEVIQFPAWDCLPYDRVSPNHDLSAARVNALMDLLRWEAEAKRYPRILLTTVNASVQKVMPKAALADKSFMAQVGRPCDVEKLQRFLVGNGYIKTETVREQGEFAQRGGIFDVFPSGFEQPVRMDMFGDDVETIKSFDPGSQRSTGTLKSFTLNPASEYFLDEGSVARFRSGYREAFGVVRQNDPLYEAISEGRRYNGMEHWQPLFFDHMDGLLDYVPKASLSFDHHVLQAQAERQVQIKDFFQARQIMQESKAAKEHGAVYNPLPPDALYWDERACEVLLEGALGLSPHQDPQNPDDNPKRKKARDFADVRATPDGDVFAELNIYIRGLRLKGVERCLLACYSEGSRDRIQGLLANAGFDDLVLCENAKDVKALKSTQLGLAILHLDHGFIDGALTVITEQDVLGDRLARKTKKKRKADNFLTEVTALAEGDLVVHVDHGVGKFIELETLKAAGALHDCLKIEYADGDRLFVPVENVEVLSRFGSDEGTVQLDKLGGAGWQARKARVKKNLMAMADQLLKIAAARQLNKAEKLDVSAEIYNEFAARFPYQETEDQDQAISDVIADLSGGVAMDRLVCGDVGFGKTEVAIRAAYVAAMAGAQVALVVPTTLLARQHYQNFKNRFEGTSIRVEQLSRLVKAGDAKRVKEGMADGSVNIVIGTHALLAKGLSFDNLGLLIVDEEQRFGVKQKERLKELKSNVHILTLTATPIPRTLQMSLTGVKDMSLITTPPVDRLAIRTFVLPFDPVVIREALLREHYRGGQSFYVCPRIKDMDQLERDLTELVPEVKILTAHGQMSATDLEDRMSAFIDGQYDVLLATNIIESGIDIPSANTMIVHKADMFGLAQLYQIRGRIGRSKMRAYAYLTYPPNQLLTPQAQKRLEVLETLDTLGAGFQLASHDMDIRGAGNLLGDQQSGHIKEVGVELYQQMLEEAVAMAREGVGIDDMPEQESWSPSINLGTSVLIPETYVEDLGTRMSLYRRLSELKEPNDLEAFAAELIDRFGKLPEEVENLLEIVSIKQLCLQAGVASLDAGPKGAVIGFHKDNPPNLGGLMQWIAEKRGSVKLRPDQKLVVIKSWERPTQRVRGARLIAQDLAKLVVP